MVGCRWRGGGVHDNWRIWPFLVISSILCHFGHLFAFCFPSKFPCHDPKYPNPPNALLMSLLIIKIIKGLDKSFRCPSSRLFFKPFLRCFIAQGVLLLGGALGKKKPVPNTSWFQ